MTEMKNAINAYLSPIVQFRQQANLIFVLYSVYT